MPSLILDSVEPIAAFGDDETAVVDTETVPARSAPGAECVTVADRRIVRSRFVFDQTSFQAAREAAT